MEPLTVPRLMERFIVTFGGLKRQRPTLQADTKVGIK